MKGEGLLSSLSPRSWFALLCFSRRSGWVVVSFGCWVWVRVWDKVVLHTRPACHAVMAGFGMGRVRLVGAVDRLKQWTNSFSHTDGARTSVIVFSLCRYSITTRLCVRGCVQGWPLVSGYEEGWASGKMLSQMIKIPRKKTVRYLLNGWRYHVTNATTGVLERTALLMSNS